MSLDLVLKQYRDVIQADDYNLEPPAKSEVLESMVQDTWLGGSPYLNSVAHKITMLLQLSPEYKKFVETMNGLEYNGVLFYGVSDSVHANASPMNILNINFDLVKDPDLADPNLADTIVVGEDSSLIFTFNFETKEFEARDRIGTDYVEQTFASFAELLEHELDKVRLD